MQLMGWVWLFAAGAGWLLMQRAKICRPLGRFLKVAAAFAALLVRFRRFRTTGHAPERREGRSPVVGGRSLPIPCISLAGDLS